MQGVIDFVKMEGAGNDYVYIDAIREPIDLRTAPDLARQVADRHFGVGGDGLIVLAASAVADVAMLMWNADGSAGAMCGNGVRCLAKLARDHGHVTADTLTVETAAGVKAVDLLLKDGEVVGARVGMGVVQVATTPATLDLGGQRYAYFKADAGNPHAVVFVDEDPREVPVHEIGAAIQDLPEFVDGVNVEVVQVRGDGSIMQRTFERGSGETLACGSGATAVACVAVELGKVPGPQVHVDLLGGRLVIQCDDTGASMEGPARTVFRGQIGGVASKPPL